MLLQSSRAPAWIQTRREEDSKALANVPVFSIGLVTCSAFLSAVVSSRLCVVAFLVRFGLRPTVIAMSSQTVSPSFLPTGAAAAAAPAAAAPAAAAKTDQSSSVWLALLLAIVMVVSDPAGAVTIFDAAMSTKLSTTGSTTGSKRLRVFEENIAVAKNMIVQGMPSTNHGAIQVSYVALLCVAALLGSQRLRSVFIDVPNGLVGANGQQPVRFNMTTAPEVVDTTSTEVFAGSRVSVKRRTTNNAFKTVHSAAITGNSVLVSALLIYGPKGPNEGPNASRNSSSVFFFPKVAHRAANGCLPETAKGSISEAWTTWRKAQSGSDDGGGGGGAAEPADNTTTEFVDFHYCLQLLKQVASLFLGTKTVFTCVDEVFAAYDGLLHNVPPSLMLSLFGAILQSLFEPGTFGRNSSFLFKHLSCGSAALARSCFCSSACLQTLHSTCSSSTPCEQDALGFCLEPGDCRYLEKDAARSCGGKAQVMFSDGRLVYVSAELSAEVLLRLGGDCAYMLVVNGQVVGHGSVQK